MTKGEFERCLAYTIAQINTKGVKMPYYKNVQALREAVDSAKFYMKYEDMPVLCWDTTLGRFSIVGSP